MMRFISYVIQDELYKYRYNYENQLFEIDVQPVTYSNYNEQQRLLIQHSIDVFMNSCCGLKLSCYRMWELK